MRSIFLICAAATPAALAASSGTAQQRASFEQFKAEYGVRYPSEREEAYRLSVFVQTLATIDEQNADPNDHAEYGITAFADRTDAEMRMKCGGPKQQPAESAVEPVVGAGNHSWDGTCYAGKRAELAHLCNGTLPDALDWTLLGAVTPIKDQGKCGNCFTFGATGDFESAWFLAGHDLVSLSEQQITSCDRNGGDAGCAGGETNLDTDQYVVKNGGIASEETYPLCSDKYKCPSSSADDDEAGEAFKHDDDDDDNGKVVRKNGICHKHLEKNITARMTGGYQVSGGVKKCSWCDVQPVDEERMLKHMVQAGPMTIAVNSKFFDNYKRGIMSPNAEKCKNNFNSLDHQILVVGFGTDSSSGKPVDYWKVKNSWNAKWGEQGYARMLRNGNNRCGIASDATHAVSATD